MAFKQTILIVLIVAALDWLLLWLWHHRGRFYQFFAKFFSSKPQREFLLGVILLLTGLGVLSSELPLFENGILGRWWNSINFLTRLDFPYFGDLILALPLLAAGAFYFSRSQKTFHLAEPRDGSRPFFPAENNGRAVIDRWIILPAVTGLFYFAILMVRMSSRQNHLIDPILWILSLSLIGFSIARYEIRVRGSLPVWKISRTEIAVCLLLLAAGLLVASFRLADHPNMLVGDDGEYFETAKGITLGYYEPALFDLGVATFPVAGSYWQAFFLILFGGGLWAWRFSSVAVSVLAVIPFYMLCLEFFGRRLAILSSICLITSPYFLAFAGLGYYNSQAIFWVTASALFIFKGYKERSLFFLFIGGAIAGFGFMTYTAGRLGLVLGLVLLGLWCAAGLRKGVRTSDSKVRILCLSIFLLGWAISAGPHFVFGTIQNQQSMNFKMYESAFFNVETARPFFADDEIFSIFPAFRIPPHTYYFNPKIFLWLFQRGFLRTALAFLAPGMLKANFLTSPIPGPIATFFFLIGIVVSLNRIRDRRFFLLLCWFFLAMILFSSLNSEPPRQAHLIPIIPPMAVFIALGIEILVQMSANLWEKFGTASHRRFLTYSFAALIVTAGVIQYFTIIPQVFKPDVENIFNFSELANVKNIPFYYINNREDRRNWRPFFVREMVPERPFHSVNEEKFLSGMITFPQLSDMVFIFEGKNYDKIAEKLRRDYHIPDKPIQPFFSEGKRVAGMLVKGNFVWPLNKSIVQDLWELIKSPSGIIACLLMLSAWFVVGSSIHFPIRLPQLDKSIEESVE